MKKLMFSSLLFSLLFCINFSSQELKQDRSLTVEQWREDLQFLVTQIKSTHPKPFFKTSEYTFRQAIKSLYKKIPEISENEIITGLLRITSLLEDGHTRLLGKNLTRLWFPVRVYEFKNGFFITATSTDYVDAIGAKIVKIGKYTVDEAFKKIKSITPHDNQYSLSYSAPGYLMMSSVLSGLNIIDNPALLNLSIKKGERIMELNIKANEFESDDDFMWYWLLDGVPSNEFVRFIDLGKGKLPMTYRNREQFYWFEYLEKSNTVYMCFNLCLDSEQEAFSAFNSRLWRFIEDKNVERLIIDLRNNIGGNNQILSPLIHDVIKHERINKKGNLFLIIGRKTWSAAMHCASWLERHTNVIFIGEPTGSAPNHYADPKRFTLPNSEIDLLVSRYYWQNSWPWDTREMIEPDTVIKIHSYDYFNHNDPVLEFILKK